MTVPDPILTGWYDLDPIPVSFGQHYGYFAPYYGQWYGGRARSHLTGFNGANRPGGDYVNAGLVEYGISQACIGNSTSGDSTAAFRPLEAGDITTTVGTGFTTDDGGFSQSAGIRMSSGHYSPGFFGATADVDISAYTAHKYLPWMNLYQDSTWQSKIDYYAGNLAQAKLRELNLPGWGVERIYYEYVIPKWNGYYVSYYDPAWRISDVRLRVAVSWDNNATRSPQYDFYVSNPQAGGNPGYTGYPDPMFLENAWLHSDSGIHAGATQIDSMRTPYGTGTTYRTWSIPNSYMPTTFPGIAYGDYPDPAPYPSTHGPADDWYDYWLSPSRGHGLSLACVHEGVANGGYPFSPLTWGSNGSSWLDSEWHEFGSGQIQALAFSIIPPRVRFKFASYYEIQDIDGLKTLDGRQFRRTR